MTCDEAFNVVMNNIDNLTDEQLSNLAFQVWAATQERGIVLCEEPSYERQSFMDGLYGGDSYMIDLRESCRIAQEQRNASNRHIEKLQDMLAQCCKNEDDGST